MSKNFWQIFFGVFFINLSLNCLILIIPCSCIINFFGGFTGIFYLQKKCLSLEIKPKNIEKIYLCLFVSLINSLLISYLSLIIFYITLGPSPENSWLSLGSFENFVRYSQTFKNIFFAICFFISFLSNILGCYFSFRSGVLGRQFGSSSKDYNWLFSKFKLQDFNIYLQDDEKEI